MDSAISLMSGSGLQIEHHTASVFLADWMRKSTGPHGPHGTHGFTSLSLSIYIYIYYNVLLFLTEAGPIYMDSLRSVSHLQVEHHTPMFSQ